MGMAPPYYTPHNSTQNNHKLPEPYWYEHCPITPLYQSILPKCDKDREDEETAVDYKFAAVHRIQNTHYIFFKQKYSFFFPTFL